LTLHLATKMAFSLCTEQSPEVVLDTFGKVVIKAVVNVIDLRWICDACV